MNNTFLVNSFRFDISKFDPESLSNSKFDVPMGSLFEDSLFVENASSISEAIIRPDAVVTIPSYFLRFIPFYGSASVLIAIALRQAFYRLNHDFELNNFPSGGDSVSVNVSALLRMLGGSISRAKFFRVFKEGKLEWYASRAEPQHIFKDDKIQRLPNTYYFNGLLLPPTDAVDLYNWLFSNKAISNPAVALKKALETPRQEIIQFPYPLPKTDPADYSLRSSSVHDVVISLLGRNTLNHEIHELCDKLSFHLLKPESFLTIPWYWFRNVLPVLGDDLGALYLMCKNCCYMDWINGHNRNTFWVKGGSATLQKWIGSKNLPNLLSTHKDSTRGRPKALTVSENSLLVREWREDKRELSKDYVLRSGTRKSDNGTDWFLRIFDTSLTAPDKLVFARIVSFLIDPANPVMKDLAYFLKKPEVVNLMKRSLSLSRREMFLQYKNLVSLGFCNFDTLVGEEISNFDTLELYLFYYFETLVEQEICNYDTIINILNKIKNTSFFLNMPEQINIQSPADSSILDVKRAGRGYYKNERWVINDILKNHGSSTTQEQLTKGDNPTSFVSWLIEGAFSIDIISPISYAISKTLKLGSDCGGAGKRMALMDPELLSTQLQTTLKRLKVGYTFSTLKHTGISEDLMFFLDKIDNNANRIKLLQRLIDILGIVEDGESEE